MLLKTADFQYSRFYDSISLKQRNIGKGIISQVSNVHELRSEYWTYLCSIYLEKHIEKRMEDIIDSSKKY